MQQVKKLSMAMGISLAIALTACNNQNAADNAVISDEQQAGQVAGSAIPIDINASKVRFVGYGVGKDHPGNFKVSEGSFLIADNEVKGGDFTIDINSLEVEEQGDIFQNKLKPHLLGEDFFDAAKHGQAHFQVTGVQPYVASAQDSSVVEGANYTVSGNLKFKDVTKNISFPANISVSNNAVTAKANFNIDRTLWNIRYGNDKSLGDKFISESVNIQLNLVAGQ
jgi:polyisoprenoid-binding protein YceI